MIGEGENRVFSGHHLETKKGVFFCNIGVANTLLGHVRIPKLENPLIPQGFKVRKRAKIVKNWDFLN